MQDLIIPIELSTPSNVTFKALKLSVSAHKTTTLMGRSGVGKTTLLQKIKYYFIKQNYILSVLNHQHNLLAWKDVSTNIIIRDRILGRTYNNERLQEALNNVGLHGYGRHRIHTLSQGMRQRVALARIFYENADIIMMDEPFTNLDVPTLDTLYPVFKSFFKGKTVIFTTHCPEESHLFADQQYTLEGNPVHIIQTK